MSLLRPISMAATMTLAGSLTALASAPPALAAPATFTQPAPITLMHQHRGPASAAVEAPLAIPDQGGATSELTLGAPVDDAVATWIDVVVTVDHPRLDEVDLVLEAPDGRAITLASDIGGNTSGERTLRFDQAAPSLPADTLDESFVVAAPTDYDTPDDLDAHQGNPQADLRVLGGTLLDGPEGSVWTLHAYDDTAENEGSVQSWSLQVYFGLPAAPSPSTLAVHDMPQSLTDVNLVLSDVEGGSLTGVELLLQSPDGRYAHALSDNDVAFTEKLDLTLDDQAATDMPQHTALQSGAFRPRNYDDDDQSEPIAGIDTMDMEAALSVFNGGPANGTWRLWVFQEYCCNTLSIGSWSLQITADDPPAAPTTPPAVPSPPAPPVADTTAPTIARTTPEHRARGVGTGATVKVAFSETMRAASLTERNVKLVSKAGRRVRTELSYRRGKSLLIVRPTKTLAAGTTYTLVVGTGARDLEGNRLAQARRVSFSTRG